MVQIVQRKSGKRWTRGTTRTKININWWATRKQNQRIGAPKLLIDFPLTDSLVISEGSVKTIFPHKSGNSIGAKNVKFHGKTAALECVKQYVPIIKKKWNAWELEVRLRSRLTTGKLLTNQVNTVPNLLSSWCLISY